MTQLLPSPPPSDVVTVPAIEVRGLTKRYGDLVAVDDLDLVVPAGGVFGLIGPNGAGKTTTMESIVTLLVPDRGTIRVHGVDARTDQREVRRLVGYMPDFFGVYDGLSCAEYLDFFASSYGLDRLTRAQQVDDLLELVELTHKADTGVQGLSRGLQQRLSLARALVHDPRVLVLDEPASGLDPRARVELREIIRELARQDRTVLVSSHILVELQEMCDRVGIIEAGRVLAQGTPDELLGGAGTTTATISLRVLGGPEAEQALRTTMAARGAVATGGAAGRLTFELVGGDEESADLLAELVAEGLRVVDFRQETRDLEDVFLRVTKGVVR